jgi:hypothetical protein
MSSGAALLRIRRWKPFATRFLRSLLSDISTTDPWVFVLAPTLLVTIALIAPPCAPPASMPPARCARIDTASVYDRSLLRGICEAQASAQLRNRILLTFVQGRSYAALRTFSLTAAVT